ncbi:glycosyl transferase [Glutamicibacter uratoxydans]|uniref:Glycosyl transferase n=1 Tax=Glutamicibacter uratoxydans TaxID=43667 RepID=A0A4Y4DTC6_GLUUR|nr:glycosyltransferase [Glutamicibacter uratoxydans]GED07877.1 glycosyl transferase [Glutamicibacter uratoxydans]
MSGAIVHEWIEEFGGAEKVVDSMMDLYPDADLWCAWNDAPGRYQGRNVFESPVAHTPLRGRKALALPFMPWAWRGMRTDVKYDWMLISSHAFAHHATFSGVNHDIPRLAYVHTPARYVWLPELDERGNSMIAKTVAGALRPLDRYRASSLSGIAANSKFIKDRIANSWGLESSVIYPPVDVSEISDFNENVLTPREQEFLLNLPSAFILGASRFVPYKKMDVVIRAGALSGLPVVLAGGGPELNRLKNLGIEMNIALTLIEEPSTNLLRALYRAASVLVFPAIEDFGIMPVEALASGTPVIVSNYGGTTETVINGINGAHIHDWRDDKEICNAVDSVLKLDAKVIKESATRFSAERFQSELDIWVRSSIS